MPNTEYLVTLLERLLTFEEEGLSLEVIEFAIICECNKLHGVE